MIEAITAKGLLEGDYPPPKMIVENLITEGLNFIAGNPKVGKSFLSIRLADCIANSKPFLGQKVRQGKVLYLALEDTKFRLQSRMKFLGVEPTRDLFFATKAPTLDHGTLDSLESWCDQNEDTQLIIIDTLARVRPPMKNQNPYADDSALGAVLQNLGFNNGVAVVVVHHMNKTGNKDFLLSLSGTAGLTGAADVVLGLERQRNDTNALLHVTGRDINEQQMPLYWAQHSGWTKAQF